MLVRLLPFRTKSRVRDAAGRPAWARAIRRARLLAPLFAFAFVFASGGVAWAAGPTASASVNTSQGAKGKKSRYKWPELVVGGNSISALLPLQFGFGPWYLPRGRIGFQYDRQIRRAHWVHAGIAVLFDRGNWDTFGLESCGLQTVGGCNPGGVAGVDIYAGYTHKFYLQELPFIVPLARASLGYSYFKLPQVGEPPSAREQTRIQSSAVSLRVGGGVRVFLLTDLSIGIDLNIPFGFFIHTDIPLREDRRRQSQFLLGIEVLPIVVEYRF